MLIRCTPALLLVAVVAGCGTSPGSTPVPNATEQVTPQTAPADAATPDAKAVQVAIDNFAFSPREITVAPGTRVTWVNHDDVPHTVTSSAKPRAFASQALDTDDRFEHVFTKPGVYEYFCAVHPKMTAKVVVE